MRAAELVREYHDSGTRVHFLRFEDCDQGAYCDHLVCLPCLNTFRNQDAHGCLCVWVDGRLVSS